MRSSRPSESATIARARRLCRKRASVIPICSRHSRRRDHCNSFGEGSNPLPKSGVSRGSRGCRHSRRPSSALPLREYRSARLRPRHGAGADQRAVSANNTRSAPSVLRGSLPWWGRASRMGAAGLPPGLPHLPEPDPFCSACPKNIYRDFPGMFGDRTFDYFAFSRKSSLISWLFSHFAEPKANFSDGRHIK